MSIYFLYYIKCAYKYYLNLYISKIVLNLQKLANDRKQKKKKIMHLLKLSSPGHDFY